MKPYLMILSIILIISSCKNDAEKNTQDQNITLEEENPLEMENDSSAEQKDTSELPPTKENGSSENFSSNTINGNYIKVGQETDAKCSCYCLEIQFNNPSELCLTPNKMYINVKFEKVDENQINVFLIEPSDINSEGDEIPWNTFDRNIPVATIKSSRKKEIAFDWLGFTRNGDLAQDYALFGKKTLEGTYIKK